METDYCGFVLYELRAYDLNCKFHRCCGTILIYKVLELVKAGTLISVLRLKVSVSSQIQKAFIHRQEKNSAGL